MKKLVIIIITLVGIISTSLAQTYTQTLASNSLYAQTEGKAITHDSYGDLYIATHNYDFYGTNPISITKTNGNGTLLWSKAYNQQFVFSNNQQVNYTVSDLSSKLWMHEKNQIAIAGKNIVSENNNSFESNAEIDYLFIMVIRPDGSVVWKKELNPNIFITSDVSVPAKVDKVVVASSETGWVVAATIRLDDTELPLILHFDNNGTIIWQQLLYNQSNINQKVVSIETKYDAAYILLDCQSSTDGNYERFPGLIKADLLKNKIDWLKQYKQDNTDLIAADLTVAALHLNSFEEVNEEVVLMGNGYDNTTHRSRVFVLSVESNGGLVNKFTYNPIDNAPNGYIVFEEAISIEINRLGYIITGNVSISEGDNLIGSDGVFSIIIDSKNSDLISQKVYNLDESSNFALDMIAHNNGFSIVGFEMSSDFSNQRTYVMKNDDQGANSCGYQNKAVYENAIYTYTTHNGSYILQPIYLEENSSYLAPNTVDLYNNICGNYTIDFFGKVTNTSPSDKSKIMTNQKEQIVKINVFPNPSSGNFQVKVPEVNSPIQLHLLDMNGRTLKNQFLQAGTNQTQFSNLPKGTYILRILGDEFQETQKVIVQ